MPEPEPRPTLVRLRRFRALEAELARAKLESEGIRCFVADENLAVMNPLVFSDVELQVAESDLERAHEILERPAENADDDDYADEEFRCPQCHRRAVDLLPLSGGWRSARIGCFTLLLLPVFVALIRFALPTEYWQERITSLLGKSLPILGLIVLTLGVMVILAPRQKRCRGCGHVWIKSVDKAGDARTNKKAGR